MTSFVSFLVLGLFTGAAYAIAASGLVLTYATTRIFNIAHGAIGMLLSFVFWDFSQRQGMPVWLSLVLVLGVVAPLVGMFVYLVQLRGFAEAPVSMALVATLGVFVGMIGLTQLIWPPTPRLSPPFFGYDGFEVAGAFVTWHQLITILLSGVVALLLYLLLNRSRTGAEMRAAVDNPELLKLYGGRPQLISTIAFAIASSLAGLAGILLTPELGMDYYQLTFLVVNAYAAAMFGRLTSLPLTFAGALMLGVLQSFAVGYLPSWDFAAGLRDAIPTLFLFAIVILMPQSPLRVGQVKGTVSPRVPSFTRSVGWGVALVVAVALVLPGLASADVLLAGMGAVYGLLMLSLVLLTGYAGYVSLAQLTFAGVGAVTYARMADPGITGLVIAATVTLLVGVLVALPVLRLTGLYLALATMAFGLLMDKLVFATKYGFGVNGALDAPRPELLGLDLGSDRTFVMTLTVLFVILSIGLLAVRRSRLGRILIAIRDSPAACGTLGLNMNWLRVAVFGASAGIAGFAGALFAALRGSISTDDFVLFASLPLVLVAVSWGVSTISGATVAALFLMFMPVASAQSAWAGAAVFLFVGFAATALAKEPNGVINVIFQLGRRLQTGVTSRRRAEEPTPVETSTHEELTHAPA